VQQLLIARPSELIIVDLEILAYPTCIRRPRLGGFLSEYRYAVWYRKTRMVWLPDGEKNEDMFIRFDTMHVRDRHTDRRTHRHRMTAKAALA